MIDGGFLNNGSPGGRMTTSARLKGLLKDFGLVEILQMMELGSMTGAIHLKQQASERIGIVYLKDGKLASCSELDPGALTLGDVLQQLGMAYQRQIDAAFSMQMQDPFSKRIGERLIDMGVIGEEQLREALRTKALWTARELSLWKEGSYEFVASPVGRSKSTLPYGEESLDLEVMGVTMEMIRYGDEWERLQKFLPQGMHTELQMAPAIPYTMQFDMRAMELLGGITRNDANGRPHTVRRAASAIRRPELEVAREVAELIRLGYVLIIPSAYHLPQLNGPTTPTTSAVTPNINNQAPNGNAGGRSNNVHLPMPAERLRMESFELLNLISRMEQDWNRRRTPEEQLPALVEFINWTMDALAETCRANNTELNPATLENLLTRNNLRYMGNYYFLIYNNTIDVEDFSTLCRNILQGDIVKAHDFFEEASIVLQRILLCVFDSINGRIASLYERLENQEVWEAMFTQFGLPRE
jgi:hypothetical protein